MTTIYCWQCEKPLGEVPTGREHEHAPKLREELGGKCPRCGKTLWPNTEKRAKPTNAIPLKMFV
ncbi:hypothetical protein E6H23_04370 [Candidatus Bathyarchaeota archaeon]|nr:MAG: hypothetical protein E6H23_04370 [Candidatus Bathyarchaeota archaeon]